MSDNKKHKLDLPKYDGKYRINYPEGSPGWRKYEYLTLLWMALHNLHCKAKSKKKVSDIRRIRDKIGIGKTHDNYEKIISEAENVLKKYKTSVKSVLIEIA